MSALDDVLDPERWHDDSYGDLVTQVSSPTGANTLDAARGELRALRAELVELREAYDEVAAKRITLHAENAAMREALSKQRVYAVATGALTTPSAMHAMMQRMVDDIDTALGGRDA